MRIKFSFFVFLLLTMGAIAFAIFIIRQDFDQAAKNRNQLTYRPITPIINRTKDKEKIQGEATASASLGPCSEHTFAKYAEEYVYAGSAEKPDWSSNPKSIGGQLSIVNATFDGVNFAGFVVLAEVSYPGGGQIITLIDARNGKIIDHGLQAERGLSFKKDSRLLIVNPQDNLLSHEPGSPTTKYYVFDSSKPINETLELVCEIK